jgi:LysM repeat protein
MEVVVSHKLFNRISVFVLLAMLAALIPLQVRAGGVCGGAYIIEKGDTVDKLAVMCGSSASAIFAANPGLKEPLTVGQTITIPGVNFGVTVTPTLTTTLTPTPATPVPATPTPVVTIVNNYYTYNYYNYYNSYGYYPATTYSGTYIVQPGDTFAGIAYSFGLTINDLMAANPYITDINTIYVGQSLYIPANYWEVGVAPIAAEESVALSYNSEIPKGHPSGTVRLIKKADEDVYISLRTTVHKDGSTAVNEYPVKGTMYVNIPAGWIDYVAYVGGIKFTGGFQLREDAEVTLTFNRSKVVVD